MSFMINYQRFFFSVIVLCSIGLNAQDKCGQEQFTSQQLQKEGYKETHSLLQKRITEKLKENRESNTVQNNSNTIIVPVAIHFPEAVESDRDCLVALAQNQIDILNADFNATNDESANWDNDSLYYPNTNLGVANVFFCIATVNHPGNTDPNLIEGEPAVTVGYNFGNGFDYDNNWSGYLNILVKNNDIGIGYSPLMGSVSSGDAIVISPFAFGSGSGCVLSGAVPDNPYVLGRTSTHEIGHFLGLRHTFSGSCISDDGILDTPNIAIPSGNCTQLGNMPACDPNEQALFQNFMDYSGDTCLYMFTQGQVDVMRAYLTSVQGDFNTDVLECSLRFSTTSNTKVICNTQLDEIDYVITYTEQINNTSPITFTLNGLPNNANYNFNPSMLSGSGTTILSLSNLGQVIPNNYDLTVSGNTITNDELKLYLTIENQVPSMPNLISPINSDEVNSMFINLDWQFIEEASSYYVEVSTNSNFSDITFSKTTSLTSLNVDTLSDDTSYFWRVKAINSCGESLYSQIKNFVTSAVTCQVFNSTENNILIPINDGEPYLITSTLTINSDLQLNDVNVTININHLSTHDLSVTLTSPQGTEVLLTAYNGDDGDNYVNTTFNQQAENPISEASAPFTGFYIPEENLDQFNNQSSIGDWILTVVDVSGQTGGEFENFSLELCGVETLNLNDFSPKTSINIWPNPTNRIVNVSFYSTHNTTKIKLLDLRGRLINTFDFKNHPVKFETKLDLSDLNKSVYILQIQNGKTITNKRLVMD